MLVQLVPQKLDRLIPYVYVIDEKKFFPWLGAQAIACTRSCIRKFLEASKTDMSHNDVVHRNLIKGGHMTGYVISPPLVDHMINAFKGRQLTAWQGKYNTFMTHSMYKYFNQTDSMNQPDSSGTPTK